MPTVHWLELSMGKGGTARSPHLAADARHKTFPQGKTHQSVLVNSQLRVEHTTIVMSVPLLHQQGRSSGYHAITEVRKPGEGSRNTPSSTRSKPSQSKGGGGTGVKGDSRILAFYSTWSVHSTCEKSTVSDDGKLNINVTS